ncbi:MAG: hypothetical protein ACOC57_04500 [Acidobacteriota bacterium]
MRKKNYFKAAAILACLGLLLLTVPGTYALEKNSPKIDFKLMLKKPAAMLSSILSFIPIFDNGNTDANLNDDSGKSGKKVKITGGLADGRPSDGD